MDLLVVDTNSLCICLFVFSCLHHLESSTKCTHAGRAGMAISRSTTSKRTGWPTLESSWNPAQIDTPGFSTLDPRQIGGQKANVEKVCRHWLSTTHGAEVRRWWVWCQVCGSSPELFSRLADLWFDVILNVQFFSLESSPACPCLMFSRATLPWKRRNDLG